MGVQEEEEDSSFFLLLFLLNKHIYKSDKIIHRDLFDEINNYFIPTGYLYKSH